MQDALSTALAGAERGNSSTHVKCHWNDDGTSDPKFDDEKCSDDEPLAHGASFGSAVGSTCALACVEGTSQEAYNAGDGGSAGAAPAAPAGRARSRPVLSFTAPSPAAGVGGPPKAPRAWLPKGTRVSKAPRTTRYKKTDDEVAPRAEATATRHFLVLEGQAAFQQEVV